MPKFICHFILFVIVSLTLLGLSILPGLASDLQTPFYIPQSELSILPQITFTPVATIYLPILFRPFPGCDFYESNNTPQQANLIQDGQLQTHCIKPKTDVDWVKFVVNSGSQMILEASDTAGDLELRLYNSNLNELDYSYSWPNHPAQISYECGVYGNPLVAGTYYAKAEHWLNEEEIVPYNISAWFKDTKS